MSTWKRWLCLITILAMPLLSLLVLILLWPGIPPSLVHNMPSPMEQSLPFSYGLDHMYPNPWTIIHWMVWIGMAVSLGIPSLWTGLVLIQGTLRRRLREGLVLAIIGVAASSLPWIAEAVLTDPLFALLVQTMPMWFVWLTFIVIAGLLHFVLKPCLRAVRWWLHDAQAKDANSYRRLHPTFPRHKPAGDESK